MKITSAGDVPVALPERDGWAPTDVDAVGDTLYVHEFYYIEVEQASDWRPRVRKIAADGSVTTLATVTDTLRLWIRYKGIEDCARTSDCHAR